MNTPYLTLDNLFHLMIRCDVLKNVEKFICLRNLYLPFLIQTWHLSLQGPIHYFSITYLFSISLSSVNHNWIHMHDTHQCLINIHELKMTAEINLSLIGQIKASMLMSFQWSASSCVILRYANEAIWKSRENVLTYNYSEIYCLDIYTLALCVRYE